MCLFRTINLCPALFSSRVKGKKDYLRCELVVVVAVFFWLVQSGTVDPIRGTHTDSPRLPNLLEYGANGDASRYWLGESPDRTASICASKTDYCKCANTALLTAHQLCGQPCLFCNTKLR